MRKLRGYLSFIFTAPAAFAVLVAVLLAALGGLVAGEGFHRSFTVVAEEFTDALRYARIRLTLSKRK